MPFPFIPWFSVASKAALRIQKKRCFGWVLEPQYLNHTPFIPNQKRGSGSQRFHAAFGRRSLTECSHLLWTVDPATRLVWAWVCMAQISLKKCGWKTLFVVQIASERWPLLESSLVSRLWAIESCVSTVYLWQLGGTSQLPPTGEDIRIMIESQDGGTAGDLEAILRQAKILDLNLTDLCS